MSDSTASAHTESPAAIQQELEASLHRENCDYVEVDEDREEEIESLRAGINFDEFVNDTYVHAETPATEQLAELEPSASEVQPLKKRKIAVDSEKLKENLKKASALVIMRETRKSYDRLFQHFLDFCVSLGFANSAEALHSQFKQGFIPADTPTWIACWIMKRCDRIDIEMGEFHALQSRQTYGTAQKMRAAMSHMFGREFGRGEQQWTEDVVTRTFVGNPSLSSVVSQYMISLRRTKVREGEIATSARAIDEDMLKRLYEYNTDNERFPPNVKQDLPPTKRNRPNEPKPAWEAGRSVRHMLSLLYCISFLCLLRYDEALRIRVEWLSLEVVEQEDESEELDESKRSESDVLGKLREPDESKKSKQVLRLKLALPFRKTHQTGNIAPFYLYANEEKPWLCPLTLYSLWLTSGITSKTGFVFRKKLGLYHSQQPEDGMTSDSFLFCFRNNLLDIGENPRPFGTHSFRRGGCQYLTMKLRWPLRDVCTWGGWAPDFDNSGTIFKYLLSYADSPTVAREDYFNPNRQPGPKCTECGRSCWCA